MDRLKMMDTFVRIAKSGSFAKAADHLGVSRSNVTKQMQQLEDHLEARLFNRTTRQIALTEIGAEYFEFCLRVLAEIGEEERSVGRRNAEPRGSLKVIVPMGLGNVPLGPIVADFMNNYPQIKVTMVLSDITLSPVDLIDSGFDLAIQIGEIQDTAIVSSKIGMAGWVACGAPLHLDRVGRPKTLAELASYNCLVHRKVAPDGVWHFSSKGRAFNVKVEGSMKTNSVIVLRAAVLAGVGISVLPRYCIGQDLNEGRLEEILPDYKVESRAINVLLPHSRFSPSKVRVFVNFLRERLRELT